MSKSLVGIVTFGNTNFTQLAIEGVLKTTSKVDIFIVVGKPGDIYTVELAKRYNIPYIIHEENKGFPASINDIYDYAWKENNYDYYISMGNDVIPYPYAIDQLIEIADTTDNEWVCGNEVSVKALCQIFPEAKQYFEGPDYIFTRFGEVEPWKLFTNYSEKLDIGAPGLSDVHNLALYKKSVFDKIGYIDVNFYPAYYEDNDYCRRAINANIKSCTSLNSRYFHFWSRTIKQETGGSNHHYFRNNRLYYILKWGGDFGSERWTVPFNGNPYRLTDNVVLPADVKISSREDEDDIIRFWRMS